MARIEFANDHIVEGAVDGNSADALFELGLMYSVGRNVEQDLVQAHKWFNLACMRGKCSAKEYRTELAQEMSKSDVAAAQRMAREWLKMN